MHLPRFVALELDALLPQCLEVLPHDRGVGVTLQQRLHLHLEAGNLQMLWDVRCYDCDLRNEAGWISH